MRQIAAKLALLTGGIALLGSAAGLGLARYAESGSFGFYRQAGSAEWRPQPQYVAAVETRDMAAAQMPSDQRYRDSFQAYSGGQ